MARNRRRHAKTCAHCGASFMGLKATTRFCSKRCSSTSRMTTPEARERSRQVMKTMIARPDVQEKLAAHLSSPSNPLRDPAVRARATEASRALGFPSLNGGNGRGPTRPQRLLADALGWPMEHAVSTGSPRQPGMPTHYKIDIANPELWIAIEVDGVSHMTRAVREADARKDAWLRSRGWTVLRFSNERVLNELPAVLRSVRTACTTSRQAPATTSLPAS